MNAQTLIECRLALWERRLSRLNAKTNTGKTHEGLVDIWTAESEAAAVVVELEHLARSLKVQP